MHRGMVHFLGLSYWNHLRWALFEVTEPKVLGEGTYGKAQAGGGRHFTEAFGKLKQELNLWRILLLVTNMTEHRTESIQSIHTR